MDSDFKSSNYSLLKTDISVNKFVTSFEFLKEDPMKHHIISTTPTL